MGKITIRRLHTGDEETAGRVAHLFKRSRGSDESLSRFLLNPLNLLIVAQERDEPVGFVIAHQLQRIDGESSKMFLYEIGVAASHRRRGIASALINELDRICQDGSFISMFVLTNRSNIPATGLYSKTGGSVENSDDLMFTYDYSEEERFTS